MAIVAMNNPINRPVIFPVPGRMILKNATNTKLRMTERSVAERTPLADVA